LPLLPAPLLHTYLLLHARLLDPCTHHPAGVHHPYRTQFYYLFGFLTLVFIILLVTCAEITIVLCYFQLCSEDYHWCVPVCFRLRSAAKAASGSKHAQLRIKELHQSNRTLCHA